MPKKDDFQLSYYDAAYVQDVIRTAEEFLLARDRYIAAWLKWRSCCLGASSTPEDESDIMRGILEAAYDAQKASESEGEEP